MIKEQNMYKNIIYTLLSDECKNESIFQRKSRSLPKRTSTFTNAILLSLFICFT